MEPIVLTDPAVEPNDEIVFSFIGEKKILWEQLMNHIHNVKKDMDGAWRYYNDGKSWLFRGLRKEKVVFWSSVIEGTFRVTFYLSAKAEQLIENSDLPQSMKDEYAATAGQKFRAITIRMESEADVDNVKKLIEIKLKVK